MSKVQKRVLLFGDKSSGLASVAQKNKPENIELIQLDHFDLVNNVDFDDSVDLSLIHI